MTRQRTLLFVGAHPDDETFGVGGTLAQYAAAGVKVYYACATRGEAGSVDPEQMQGHATLGDMRWAELKCAAQILGLADVIHLGYRDSGMSGSEDKKHRTLLSGRPRTGGPPIKAIRVSSRTWYLDPIGGLPAPRSYRRTMPRPAFHAAIRDSTRGRWRSAPCCIRLPARHACWR